MEAANTLAYYNTAKITTVKSFIAHVPGVNAVFFTSITFGKNKLGCFSLASNFWLVQYFRVKPKPAYIL